ncbi:MAG: hypothetical protein JWM31_3747, partial [Solirubrobacterales bacterium]|nr:hypothetical protein [Solirubrobacterales bacterium]
MVVVSGEGAPRSRAVALTTVLDDAPTLLEQAVAVLRTWPPAADLALAGVDDPADLPVGLADRALLTVNEEVLGVPLEHTVACDRCGELTTLPLARNDIPEHHPRSALTGPGSGVREPTWRDLLASGDDAVALLTRCSVGAGGTLEDLARVEGSLSGPLHAMCAGCGTHLELDVDVMALVLRALGAVPADLDRDVHVLASRYGWDLAVIEALP